MRIAFRRSRRRLVAAPLLALTVALAVPTGPAFADRYDRDERYEDRRGGYNSEYLFAATRSVTEMDTSPVVKVPLIPLTLVLDLAILPFEAIAGLF
jgi:hypothetical protein